MCVNVGMQKDYLVEKLNWVHMKFDKVFLNIPIENPIYGDSNQIY